MTHLTLTLLFTTTAYAGQLVTCSASHAKAVSACSAHEHSLNAASLSIISIETRERVVKTEQAKLVSFKAQCLKTQDSCSLICDEEVETASLDGEDLTLPLEKLTDCRQGQVAIHLIAIDKKLVQLRRLLNNDKVAGHTVKNASNR